METQVLVVGAGPVGLTMAAELKRYGQAVRIVDKARARTDKSKALVLWSRTLELLDRAGCAGAFVTAGLKVVGADMIASGKPLGHVDLTDIHSPYAYALMLPQAETERLLEEHLGRLGVTVERSVEMVGFEDDGTAVSAHLREADGREETVRTAWLAGCDGAHSLVRHMLGFGFEGDTLESDWLLADVHIAGAGAPRDAIAIHWHAEGMLVLFPIMPGRVRVIADLGAAPRDHPVDPTLEEVQAIVERRGPGGMHLSDPVWLSAFRINERKVKHYRAGRVFLAGDAAHVHSPAGGQGMNTGMQDAINLAWKLALVCRGASDTLLDSYSVERSAVGDRVLADAGRLTTVATLRGGAAQSVRNLLAGVLLGLSPVRQAMADTLSETSIGYPDSPLNGASALGLGGPAPGQRVAPVAGERPFGSGDEPRFALLAARSEATARLLRDFPVLLEREARPPLRKGGAWLVRPDGYVAAVARDAHVGVFAETLRGLQAPL